jgi:hypothetical protein
VRQPQPAVAGASAIALAVAVAAVALVWWWLAVTPWNDTVLPLLVFVPVPVVVHALTRGSGLRSRSLLGVWAVVVAVMVGTVALGSSGALERIRLGGTLDDMAADARTRLTSVGVPSEKCSPPPSLHWGPLGPPAEVCVVAYDIIVTPVRATAGQVADGVDPEALPVRQVRYQWDRNGASPGRTLVFEAAVAQPPADRCVRVMAEPWWAWRTDDGECPRGFAPSSG